MAVPVYSIHIYAAVGLSGSSPSLGPPAGFRWILRDLDVTYSGLLVSSVRLIGPLGQTIWLNAFAGLSQPEYASWRGRQVVDFPDSVTLTASQPSDVTLSGYQLTLP